MGVALSGVLDLLAFFIWMVFLLVWAGWFLGMPLRSLYKPKWAADLVLVVIASGYIFDPLQFLEGQLGRWMYAG